MWYLQTVSTIFVMIFIYFHGCFRLFIQPTNVWSDTLYVRLYASWTWIFTTGKLMHLYDIFSNTLTLKYMQMMYRNFVYLSLYYFVSGILPIMAIFFSSIFIANKKALKKLFIRFKQMFTLKGSFIKQSP